MRDGIEKIRAGISGIDRSGRTGARLLVPIAMVLLAGRLPSPGGEVTIYLPDSGDGGAIETALRSRMTTAYLVHPDGRRSRLESEAVRSDGGSPSAAGASHWILHVEGSMAASVEAIAVAIAGDTLPMEAPGPWSDVDTVWTEGEEDGASLHLRFTGPVCDPAPRFARWSDPAPGLIAPFLERADRRGTFGRRSGSLWPPLLDAITLVRTDVPPRPGPGEISIVPGMATAGDRGGPVFVGYRLTVAHSLESDLTRWLRETLPRSAFAPLFPARVQPGPGWVIEKRTGEDVAPTLAPDALIERGACVRGIPGARGTLLRERVLFILADRGVPVAACESASGLTDPIVLRLDRIVRFGMDPIMDAATADDGADRIWPVLIVAYHSTNGSNVIGSVAAPDRIWRADETDGAGTP